MTKPLYHQTWLYVFLLGLSASVWGATPTLQVSPASVSNTFGGTIALTISGLTNGEPVLLEKFLDANGSGTVDVGEPLVASHGLTDGTVSSFAGIRDRNVPGDDDLNANGEIQVHFTLQGITELEQSISKYVCRVSSPSGRFTSVSQVFSIEPATYPQFVSGVVTNSSGAPVAYAGVAALSANQEFVAAVIGNAAGTYRLPLPPGDYQLIPVGSGYVADTSALPPVSLGADQSVTANLAMKAGTRTLAGKVRDAQTQTGLAGMQMFFESAAGETVLTFTDATGGFSAAVSPGSWTLQTSEMAAMSRGYPSPRSRTTTDTTAGNVTGVMIDLTRGTSLVYGRLTDDQAQPVKGVRAYCSDNPQLLEGSGLTDANGDYYVVAGPGDWSVGFSSEMLTALGLIVPNANVSLTTGQAKQVNFVAVRPNALLGGFVYDLSSKPITNILVMTFRQDGPGQAFTRTGTAGEFELPVLGGLWQVQVETFEAAQRGLLAPMRTITVTDGVNTNNIVLIAPSINRYITGRVTNHVGQAIANLDVYVFNSSGNQSFNANARTDANGNFSAGVIDGTWQVGLPCEQLTPRGYVCQTAQSVTVSGANRTANLPVVPLPPTLGAPSVSGNSFRCTVNGHASFNYLVRYTTDFKTWTPLGSASPGPTFQISDALPQGAGQRFYRVEISP